jgi:hypothetical protein
MRSSGVLALSFLQEVIFQMDRNHQKVFFNSGLGFFLTPQTPNSPQNITQFKAKNVTWLK